MVSKGICLISGGIDSPMAAYLMSKKMEIIPLHFSLYPYSSRESTPIVLKTLEILQERTNFSSMVFFPFGKILDHIFDNLNKKSYACVFCRKAMFKTASKICDRIGGNSIITGESLGQKASQTIDNLKTTSFNIKYPIHRPLIGLDKDEIVEKSKNAGLFLKKHAGCYKATPKNPRTKSNPLEIDRKYKKMDLNKSIDQEMEKLKILDIRKTEITEIYKDIIK
ncbi:MAG: hypothetical protein ABEK36_01360 [Candidatus Aenigmatarchaeota archaeon]